MLIDTGMGMEFNAVNMSISGGNFTSIGRDQVTSRSCIIKLLIIFNSLFDPDNISQSHLLSNLTVNKY